MKEGVKKLVTTLRIARSALAFVGKLAEKVSQVHAHRLIKHAMRIAQARDRVKVRKIKGR
jgi:hypothetical protein